MAVIENVRNAVGWFIVDFGEAMEQWVPEPVVLEDEPELTIEPEVAEDAAEVAAILAGRLAKYIGYSIVADEYRISLLEELLGD
jgi:hypothetical protein